MRNLLHIISEIKRVLKKKQNPLFIMVVSLVV